MLDSKFYRFAPYILEKCFEKRGSLDGKMVVEHLLHGDKKLRESIQKLQETQKQKNQLDDLYGQYMSKKIVNSEGEMLKKEIQNHKETLILLEKEVNQYKINLQKITEVLPNLVLDSVPFGTSEEENVELYRWNVEHKTLEEKQTPFLPFRFDNKDIEAKGYCTPFLSKEDSSSKKTIPEEKSWMKDHVTLGGSFMDFNQSRIVSGSRFVYLRGPLARLERALGQFLLDVHEKYFDYEEFHVPILVQPQAMYGAGQLPKFAQDLFETTNGYFLIPTGEVPLVTWLMDKTLTSKDLPIKMTTLSPCFRSEAGSSGKDTTGMLRHHQFYKVEMVVACWGYEATYWHEHMVYQSECILRALDLPHRRVLLCSGDMGQHSLKTYDLEVWMPSQKRYREIASCSQCGDYQSIRMNTRFKKGITYEIDKNRTFVPQDSVLKAMEESGSFNTFPHTLNASGLPTGRLLMALMENHQDQDGNILLPEILKPYLSCDKLILSNNNKKII